MVGLQLAFIPIRQYPTMWLPPGWQRIRRNFASELSILPDRCTPTRIGKIFPHGIGLDLVQSAPITSMMSAGTPGLNTVWSWLALSNFIKAIRYLMA